MPRRGKPDRERQGRVRKLSDRRHFGTNACQVAQDDPSRLPDHPHRKCHAERSCRIVIERLGGRFGDEPTG